MPATELRSGANVGTANARSGERRAPSHGCGITVGTCLPEGVACEQRRPLIFGSGRAVASPVLGRRPVGIVPLRISSANAGTLGLRPSANVGSPRTLDAENVTARPSVRPAGGAGTQGTRVRRLAQGDGVAGAFGNPAPGDRRRDEHLGHSQSCGICRAGRSSLVELAEEQRRVVLERDRFPCRVGLVRSPTRPAVGLVAAGGSRRRS